MGFSRNILLWMSENSWMKKNIPHLWFVRKAVKKFMPGETEDAALRAAEKFAEEHLQPVFTRLGENINDLSAAEKVRDHYLQLINKISERKLDVEISIKLTQLGLDISEDAAFEYCKIIAKESFEKLGNRIFIDMEGSAYTQRTIDFFKRINAECENVGLCLQAYLYRTEKDLEELLEISAAIRLVKGAYREPESVAIQTKNKIDENYFYLSKRMMSNAYDKRTRIIFATHDALLVERLIKESKRFSLSKKQLEFQMLYGIRMNLLRELNHRGYKTRVLIAYGNSWYPWYVRRLAERPANVWFVLKNIF
jgi:proline dehydrogenase